MITKRILAGYMTNFLDLRSEV